MELFGHAVTATKTAIRNDATIPGGTITSSTGTKIVIPPTSPGKLQRVAMGLEKEADTFMSIIVSNIGGIMYEGEKALLRCTY
jgi:hypothetical protein